MSVFLMALFGGITSLVSLNAPYDDARMAVPIIGGIGAMVVLFTLLLPCRALSPVSGCYLSALGADPDAVVLSVLLADPRALWDGAWVLRILGSAVSKDHAIIVETWGMAQARSRFSPLARYESSEAWRRFL